MSSYETSCISEYELLDLLLRELLERDARARVDEQSDRRHLEYVLVAQALDSVATISSSPRPTTMTRSWPRRSLTRMTSPRIGVEHLDDVQRLVEDDLGALDETEMRS